MNLKEHLIHKESKLQIVCASLLFNFPVLQRTTNQILLIRKSRHYNLLNGMKCQIVLNKLLFSDA